MFDEWMAGLIERDADLDKAAGFLEKSRDEVLKLALFHATVQLGVGLKMIGHALQQNADDMGPIIRYHRREVEDAERGDSWREPPE